jgi:hypothetical protein
MDIEPEYVSSDIKTHKKMELAVKLCEYCDIAKQHQYKVTPFMGSSLTACGYTAPLMAIIVMFLDKYNITDLERMNLSVSHQGTCRKLDLNLLTNGINQCVGYLWNLHLARGVGIDALILNASPVFKKELSVGPNVISFVSEETGLSVHHTFIYVTDVPLADYFVVDSWGAPGGYRLPVIRNHAPLEILRVLARINALTNSPGGAYELNNLMITYFGDPVPGGSRFNKLTCRVLANEFIESITNKYFWNGCAGEMHFGGEYKTKKNKTKKNKTKKNKTKKNKTKKNKTKRKK